LISDGPFGEVAIENIFDLRAEIFLYQQAEWDGPPFQKAAHAKAEELIFADLRLPRIAIEGTPAKKYSGTRDAFGAQFGVWNDEDEVKREQARGQSL